MASGKSIRAGKAFVEISLRDKLTGQLNKLQDKLKVTGAAFQSAGVAMAGVGVAVGAAMVPAIMAASNLEEVMNKFNVVFGENSKAIKAWGDNFASQVGRSKRQIAEFLAESQDLFVPLGFDQSSAAALSKTVTKLAVDLASFNNMQDADVLRDFKAALTGSGEVMKKYGVIVSEAAVKQELMNQGLDPKAAVTQEKVQARLNIIMRGVTAAQGDATRSAGSFANQMKRLTGNLEDTGAAIGSALLPVITPLVNNVSRTLKLVADWAAANKTLVSTLAKVAGVVTVVGLTLIALGAAMKAAAVAQATLLALSGPAGWAALAIGVGVAAAATYALSGAMDDSAKSAGDAAGEINGATSAIEAFSKKANASDSALSPLLATLDKLTERMRRLAKLSADRASFQGGFRAFSSQDEEEKQSLVGNVLDEIKQLRKLTAAAKGPVNELRRSLADIRQAAADGVLPDGIAGEVEAFLNAEIGKQTGLTDALRAANDELNLMAGSVSEIDLAMRKFINGGGTLDEADLLREALEKVEAAKVAADAANRGRIRLDSIAASAIEETRTPEERFEKRLSELQSVRGKIGESTFAKAVNQAAEKMQAGLDGVKRAASFSLDTASNLGLNLRSAAGVHAQANILRGVTTNSSLDEKQLEVARKSKSLLSRIEKILGDGPPVVESPV